MAQLVKKTIAYGNLSQAEHDAGNNTYFGSGNTAAGYHSMQLLSQPNALDVLFAKLFGQPEPQTEILSSVGLKVHLRQGADITPDNAAGTHYTVPAGSQPGNADRAAWNVDFSFLDNDGKIDFQNATIKVDINPTSGKTWLTFKYDASSDMFAAKDANGDMHYLETGHGPANVLQDSINLMFFADLIDNDGKASNGHQAWDLEHGIFDFEVSQYVPGILGSGIGAQTITSAVTVEIA